jgi:3'-phosphoadenosine 5'-phosphosulfate sulfotransferase (PAPS reductase)/FAD synthetase
VTQLRETLDTLAEARKASPSALVAYSGGKDSRVVMDLACKTFDHVEGLFKYLVPGLDLCEAMLEDATKRWGVRFRQYPSQNAIKALRLGIYCDPKISNEDLPELTSWNIYAAAIRDSKIPLVLTGMKRADSQSRRRFMRWSSANQQIRHPVAGWRKADVLAYLRHAGIPIPASSGGASTGVELVARELEWLALNHPADFRRVCQLFPYAEACKARLDFYGKGQKGAR